MVIGRWNRANGKVIRPVWRTSSGWKPGAPPPPRLLYNLPAILQANSDAPIVVVEGEKCADAVTELGFVGTTSPHGAQAAKHADWTPLSGREVWVIPDHDQAGLKYAQDVTRRAYGAGAKRVTILPWEKLRPADHGELPSGYDLADWLEYLGSGADPDKALRALAAHIVTVAQQTPPQPRQVPKGINPTDENEPDPPPPALPWQPYPVEALPRPLCDFVKAAAESMNCDPTFIALPVMVAAGAAIGLTRQLQVKENWVVPPILWGMIVGESGSLKTPALETALQWLRARQETWFKEYEASRDRYQHERLEYEKTLAEWKRNRQGGEPPREPDPPMAKRIIVADTTMEALAPILQTNPRGLLVARDELAGWVGAFDRYANTQGGDVAFWLSCYNAVPHTVDRRSKGTVHVPKAAVWIIGGIQPGILQRAFTLPLRESGLLARFLLSWPPRRVKTWMEASIPEGLVEKVGEVFDRLLSLDFELSPEGELRPRIVKLLPAAKATYQDFYNAHAEEQADAAGDWAAALAKLEEIPLRLGLILHLVRWTTGEVGNCNAVDAESLERAITLTNWHKQETDRVYNILARGLEGNRQEELVQWIARQGGRVTVRDITHGLWRFRGKQEEAKAALEGLVRAGLGQWKDVSGGQKGGKPKTVFELHHHITTSPEPHKSRFLEGYGDGDAGDARKTAALTRQSPNITPPICGRTESGRLETDTPAIRWIDL